jgi:small subunit ribosomal protein S1
VPGTVTRLTEFGAFVRLDGDIEGLIHVSELADGAEPAPDVVAPGEEVQVRVIKVDPERRRIGLSLKRAGADHDADLTPEALAALEETLRYDEAE